MARTAPSSRRPSVRQAAPAQTPPRRLRNLLIGLGLVAAILLVYEQVAHFEFIHYDDPVYVYKNDHVTSGLTPASIRWALTAVVAGNWSPVTTLSHIVVYQLFRMQAGMHHLVNVVFHVMAALLLFAAFERATKAPWPSAFVAFVFALHPLHVESVAWVSERKDVLSAFFWFLGLYAYVWYAERPGTRRYLVVAAALCLGMLSKTMLVTFPFTLLLFDIWPLRRAEWPRVWKKLIWEKLPLFGISAAGALSAYLAQRSSGALSDVALPLRIENALLSYVTYIGKTFWPTRLAWFYMYPVSIPVWQALTAAAALLAISAVALFHWRTRPYIATGWFWYLGTLVPVIGLVQIGAPSHADRYTYIPMVGLTVILAWGAAEIVKRWTRMLPAMAVTGAALCLACMALARTQAAYWQNGETLFQHGIDVTENNYWSKYHLAHEYYEQANDLMNSGQRVEAIDRFEAALRILPDWAEAHNNLAIALANMPGHAAEALSHFESAVRLDPNLAQAQRNLGMLLASIPGRTPDAIAHLEAAERLHPDPEVEKTLERLSAHP